MKEKKFMGGVLRDAVFGRGQKGALAIFRLALLDDFVVGRSSYAKFGYKSQGMRFRDVMVKLHEAGLVTCAKIGRKVYYLKNRDSEHRAEWASLRKIAFEVYGDGAKDFPEKKMMDVERKEFNG